MLVQYFLTYTPYLEAVSTRNPRTHLAVVTRDPVNVFIFLKSVCGVD
jgi:hypothetical protein